jgi:hypothetical protein
MSRLGHSAVTAAFWALPRGQLFRPSRRERLSGGAGPHREAGGDGIAEVIFDCSAPDIVLDAFPGDDGEEALDGLEPGRQCVGRSHERTRSPGPPFPC